MHVRLLDLASGGQRDVYSAPADLRLDHLQFIGQHDLQFELKPLALYQLGDVPLRGPRYAVHDDGTDGHYLDPPNPPWSTCGLPPQGYEDGHDIAWWCEEYGNGFCRFHLVYVDRAKETARELATIDEPQSSPSLAAVSPDGRQVAVVTGDTSGSELLHLVGLIGLNGAGARDVPLGYSFVPDAAWFPDGNAVLLYGPGP